jgi:hypothetical protein
MTLRPTVAEPHHVGHPDSRMLEPHAGESTPADTTHSQQTPTRRKQDPPNTERLASTDIPAPDIPAPDIPAPARRVDRPDPRAAHRPASRPTGRTSRPHNAQPASTNGQLGNIEVPTRPHERPTADLSRPRSTSRTRPDPNPRSGEPTARTRELLRYVARRSVVRAFGTDGTVRSMRESGSAVLSRDGVCERPCGVRAWVWFSILRTGLIRPPLGFCVLPRLSMLLWLLPTVGRLLVGGFCRWG